MDHPEQNLWHSVMATAFKDAKTCSKARAWLHSEDADLVAEYGGWDVEAFHIFLDKVHASGWKQRSKSLRIYNSPSP